MSYLSISHPPTSTFLSFYLLQGVTIIIIIITIITIIIIIIIIIIFFIIYTLFLPIPSVSWVGLGRVRLSGVRFSWLGRVRLSRVTSCLALPCSAWFGPIGSHDIG